MNFQEKLTKEIYNAVKMILMDLFSNKEHYYYVTLVTDGGANTPCFQHGLMKRYTGAVQMKENRRISAGRMLIHHIAVGNKKALKMSISYCYPENVYGIWIRKNLKQNII